MQVLSIRIMHKSLNRLLFKNLQFASLKYGND